MGFLTSSWLFAIAAISIPVIIHLWNIKPGKTLKVGSIALIETSSRKRSRSLKLIDILLLMLRCLFLLLIAIVLSMPFFKQLPGKSNSKGWLLIPAENFREAYKKFKTTADSLLKAGYELHYFNSGFKNTTIEQALAGSGPDKVKNNISYWNLLRQLNERMPASFPVYLITPGSLNRFSGDRPRIALNLNWRTYIRGDSSVTWIEKAWFTEDKNVHVVVGTSEPSGTYFNAVNISSSVQQNSPYIIDVSDGKPVISIKNNNQTPVEIDTSSLNIDIFNNNSAPDGRYVSSALQAIAQFTQRPVIVKSFSRIETGSLKKDWLFWLSDKPVDQELLTRYRHILSYESGKTIALNSWLVSGDVNSVSQERQKIALYKSTNAGAPSGDVIWHDGFGNAILTKGSQGHVYHFYSRFNPSWNDLVWSAQFPQNILALIAPEDGFLNKSINDLRSLDINQMIPAKGSGINDSRLNDLQNTDITHYFWLLLTVIFFLERWLANKKRLTI